jgi:hypothetical protein
MDAHKMSTGLSFLETSLTQLNAITKESYNEQIAPVALKLWRKHLRPENPQWEFITAKPFSFKDMSGSAHVIAMVDRRLPNIGLVGYFACTNSVVGAIVLEEAVEWLKNAYGLKDVYGPINGTLPSDYRINLDDDFCFPGEPVNPSWYINAFEKAGFGVFNRYVSGISKHYQLLMKLVIRSPHKGYRHLTVRPFNTDKHEEDFKTYHGLRNAIFPFQSIYCPAISLSERIYNSSGKFDPKYTYFLVDKGLDVGFVMAYAYNQKLVLKTIGLLPEYQGKRLSGLLLKPIHDQASKAGLGMAIYGMVRVGNTAYKMKKPGVKAFRKYVTMHKTLE